MVFGWFMGDTFGSWAEGCATFGLHTRMVTCLWWDGDEGSGLHLATLSWSTAVRHDGAGEAAHSILLARSGN